MNGVNEAPTFSLGGGTVATSIGWSARAEGVVIQPDGKIVVAGSASFTNNGGFAIARYNVDGSLDTSFGNGGVVAGSERSFGVGGESARSVALQADGKIVVAGIESNSVESYFRIHRYNADGSLDETFGGGDGKITTGGFSSADREGAQDVLLQADGKIVAAGGGGGALGLARYNTDGSLDGSFGSGGKVTAPNATARSAVLQADGKIIVAGDSVLRYEADGDLDATFDGDGRVTPPDFSADAVALQADGKILLAGATLGADAEFTVLRLNGDGSVDLGFGVAGKVVTDFAAFAGQPGASFDSHATGVTLQANGQILVAGYVREVLTSPGTQYGPRLIALARYNVDGTLDTAVTTDTVRYGADTAYDIALQPDGSIVVVGESSPTSKDDRFTVVRYRPDLSLDPTFVNALDATPTYLEGGPPVILDGDAQIYDPDLDYDFGNYDGATLTITRRGGANVDDAYSATGLMSPLTQGEHVFYDRGHVGTVISNSGGTLSIVFRGVESKQWRVNEVLQGIAYANTSITPPSQVMLDYTFNDGSPGHGQGTGATAIATGSITVDIIDVDRGITVTGDDTGNTIIGTNDSDTLSGLGGNDTLLALAGDDSLAGGAAEDRIDGGGGHDTATYAGDFGQYHIARDRTAVEVIANGDGESDVLTSVEVLQFNDGVLDLLPNPRDYNGDGRDDALLRDATGDLVLWDLDESGIIGRKLIKEGLSDSWSLFPADVDGDHHTDILLYGNGALVLWEMNGGELGSSQTIREQISPDWNLNVADFTGDGKADVLLNHTNGAVVLWEMDGGRVVESRTVNEGVSPDWQMFAADINGDGHSDVLLRHPNGALVEWEMHNGRVVDTRLIRDGISASWDMSFADLNGDLMADAILHDGPSGSVVIWEMNDGRTVGESTFNVEPGATLLAGHYTGDSGADILVRGPSGDVVLHELHGAQLLDELLLAQAMSPAWTLV